MSKIITFTLGIAGDRVDRDGWGVSTASQLLGASTAPGILGASAEPDILGEV